MANDSTNFLYWYRRYKVRAVDMTTFEQGMVDLPRGLGQGLVGGGVLTGFEVSASGGFGLTVDPGIAVGASGYLEVINTQSPLIFPASAVGSLPSRSLIVVSKAPFDTNYIASPTAPFSQVPLYQRQAAVVRIIQGAASGTPNYPAKLDIDDVVLCGLVIPPSAASIDSSMLDFEVRETVGTNSQLQKQQNHWDDRLRPYRSGPKSVGLKSSQSSGSNAKLFSYPSKSTPSVFPLSGGVHNDLDTFVDMSTGAISGGDGTSSPFAPVIPSGNQSVICAISLNSDDTLSFAYGTPGTLSQCLTAIANQTLSGAGSVPSNGGLYTICYAIVTSVGGVYSDVQVLDTRPLGGGGGGGSSPIFFDSLLGTGDGVTTVFALPEKPKDSSSVLPRLDGICADTTEFTVNVSAPSITFSTAPAVGQTVSAFGVASGPSSVSGHYEKPAGTVNGTNTVFSLSVQPVDKNSSLLLLDGDVLDPSEWSLIQSSGVSYVQFNTAPAVGQSITFFCIINVIAAGNLPPQLAMFVAKGSRPAPQDIDPTVGILPTSDSLQHWFVDCVSSGAQVVTATPQIAPGTQAGQVIKITAIVPSLTGGYPVFQDGNGISLNGTWPASGGPIDGASIEMSWDGSQWNENSRR